MFLWTLEIIPAQTIVREDIYYTYHVYFGSGAKADFKEAYMNAKKNLAIRFSM